MSHLLLLAFRLLASLLIAVPTAPPRAPAGPAPPVTPSAFAFLTSPVGLAATKDQVLATSVCGDVSTIDLSGTVRPFATLPGNTCAEAYLAISPGGGGFAAGRVYVSRGPTVVQIPPDGSSVTPFVTIPSLPADHSGITFDTAGSFGHEMILTGSNGEVWRVSGRGITTKIASLGRFIEGPAVVPLSSPQFGGQILVADERDNTVFAVSPTGSITPVVRWPGAEQVAIIPTQVCGLARTDKTAFLASSNGQISSFPKDSFAGLEGQILVTSEPTAIALSAGVGLLQLGPTGPNVRSFFAERTLEEAMSFVSCSTRLALIAPARRPSRCLLLLLVIAGLIALAAILVALLWRAHRQLRVQRSSAEQLS